MKLIRQEIDTQEITDYCGIIYQGKPLTFSREYGSERFHVVNLTTNTVIPIEDLDPSKISEEVFFDNSIDLYEWAANRLKAEGYLVQVYYKTRYGFDIIDGDLIFMTDSKEESFIRQELINRLPHLSEIELLEFKIIN